MYGLSHFAPVGHRISLKIYIFCLNYSKKFDSNKFEQYRGKYDKRFAKFRFDLALEAVWNLIQDLNKYVDTNKPWELAKTDSEKGLIF
jgi:methionyl-tRNA synthetase